MSQGDGLSEPCRYDAILCGLGIEALALGALLAKRGQKVLLLDWDDEPGAQSFLCQDGFAFDSLPSFWMGMRPERPHPALAELGLSVDWQPLDPGLQVILPRHRLSLYAREDLFWREMKREFPHVSERLEILFRRLEGLRGKMGEPLEREFADPPRTLEAKWSQWRRVSFSPFAALLRGGMPSLSPHLKAVGGVKEASSLIDVLLLGFGGTKGENCSSVFASLLFGLLREKVYYPHGGAKTVHETLSACFMGNGGEIWPISRPVQMLLEGKEVRGIRMTEGVELRSRVLVGGPGLWEIYSAAGNRNERPRQDSRPPLNQYLVLFLGVAQEVIHPEMKEHLLLLPKSARSSAGGRPIWMLLNPKREQARAPEGKRALSIMVPLPGNWRGNRAELQAKAEELLGDLEEFMPFLSQHIHFQRVGIHRSFSMLQPGKRWGLRLAISPLKQMGYPGLRAFSPQKNLFFIGELPAFGVGLRARIDAAYYWANLLAPFVEG